MFFATFYVKWCYILDLKKKLLTQLIFSELSPILPALVLTWLATCSKPLLKQAANKWPKSVIKLSPFGALAPSLGWDALVACCPTMYDRGRISPVKVENNPAVEAWLLTDFFCCGSFSNKNPNHLSAEAVVIGMTLFFLQKAENNWASPLALPPRGLGH